MAIANIDIELDKPGMNLVLGRNLDDARFDSNGSGKSSIFEAMTWGLFGELLRPLTSEEIIRNGTSKVTVEVLVDPEDGGEKVWFVRHRTKKVHAISALTESGIELFPANSVKDIQPQVNTWLGLDFKTFTNSVYFGKGLVKFFMASNDAERKDLLETILQLVSFDDALERAKLLSKKCGEDITEYTTSIAVSEALKNDKTNSLVGLQLSLNGAKVRIEKEQPVLKVKAIELQETRDKIFGSIGRLDELVKKEKELFDEHTNAINTSYDKNVGVIDKTLASEIEQHQIKYKEKMITIANALDDDLNLVKPEVEKCFADKQTFEDDKDNLRMNIAGQIEAVNELERKKKHISSFSGDIPCKECLQPVSISHKEQYIQEYTKQQTSKNEDVFRLHMEGKEIEEKWVENNNKIRELETKRTDIFNKHNTEMVKIDNEKTTLFSNLREQSYKAKELLNTFRLSNTSKAQEEFHSKTNAWIEEKNVRNIEVVKLDNKIITTNKDITEMEEGCFKLNRQVMDTQKDIDRVSKQAIFAQEKIIVTNEIDRKTKFWIEGFGPRGIKSFIFESALPYLTERANHYSSYITGGTVVLDILPTTMVKSKNHADKEKLSVSAKNIYGANIYPGNSDGERRRIDICILLALQDLISTRASKTWSTLIFDEIFDTLDKTGIEHVLDLFRTIKGKSIYIVSHSEDLKKHFDTSIIIQKKDGISSIKEIV